VRCFYHEGYYFPLPAEHPFPMDKFWRSAALVRAATADSVCHLLSDKRSPSALSPVVNSPVTDPEVCHLIGDKRLLPAVTILAVEPAPFAQILRVHTPDYLERIRTGALDHLAALKLGLPACEALLTRSRLEVAGTIAAARAALTDGLACNLAGGTHHAFPDHGQGYCVLNDVAIAIRELHAEDPALRVFVLDTDAHQGNGTHAIFAADSRVFTYSIHVGKNYPALKTPGSLDVALPRYVPGADYLEALESTLAPALHEFAADLIIWIAGADPHEHDRFGQMKLTDADLAARDHHILQLVTNADTPTAILYGGGYNHDREHTARIHAATVLRAAQFFRPKL
jgi:acetoin utilization deacetylase AcuC-like enzyme